MNTQQELMDFIEAERGRFDVDANNYFAFSFSNVIKYRRFLDIIIARMDPLATAYAQLVSEKIQLSRTLPANGRLLTARELELTTAISDKAELLHLEIETFYQFSKILLDRTGHAFEVYFGQRQNCSFRSFRHFRESMEKLGSEFSVGDEIPKIFSDLQEEISEYRDKRVVHENRPAVVHAISVTNGTSVTISPVFVRAKSLKDFEGSQDPRALILKIDSFLTAYVALIRKNRMFTKLQLVSEPNPS